MELPKVIIHLVRRCQFYITEDYLLPHRSGYSLKHQNDQSSIEYLPREPGLVSRDFNAHHSSWEDYVCTDPRGSARHDCMEAQSMVVLNYSTPTRTANGDKSAGIGTSVVSLVDTAMAHRFSWETISEHGSDHLPLLLIWDRDIKVERVHAKRRPNYPKEDLAFFHECLDDSIHAVLSVGSLSKRLEAFYNLL